MEGEKIWVLSCYALAVRPCVCLIIESPANPEKIVRADISQLGIKSNFGGSTMGLFNMTIENSTIASGPWKNGLTYWSSFEFYPDWRGGRFDIFRGVAHHQREWLSKTDVVVRTFKDPGATHQHWSDFRRCANEARKLADSFNELLASLGIQSQVRFSMPAFAVMDNISDIMTVTRMLMKFNKRFSEDEVVAFEELIQGDFKTFIDERGTMTDNRSEMLDAFCHFSYHSSNGEYVLNNLKGVKNGPDHEDNPNAFCLTTPCFHSRSLAYGSTDMGENGIREFFKTHQCSAICQRFIGFDSDHFSVGPSAPGGTTEQSQDQNEANPETRLAFDNTGLVRPPSYEESISQSNGSHT